VTSTELQRGFGLIDALVALLLLTLGVVVAMRHERLIAADIAVAGQRTHAAALAHDALDAVRARAALGALDPGTYEHGDHADRDGTRYERHVRTGAVLAGHRFVQVEVRWPGRNGRARVLQAITLVVPTDLQDAARLASPAPPDLRWSPVTR
jgi:hypothetical protein